MRRLLIATVFAALHACGGCDDAAPAWQGDIGASDTRVVADAGNQADMRGGLESSLTDDGDTSDDGDEGAGGGGEPPPLVWPEQLPEVLNQIEPGDPCEHSQDCEHLGTGNVCIGRACYERCDDGACGTGEQCRDTVDGDSECFVPWSCKDFQGEARPEGEHNVILATRWECENGSNTLMCFSEEYDDRIGPSAFEYEGEMDCVCITNDVPIASFKWRGSASSPYTDDWDLAAFLNTTCGWSLQEYLN